MFIKLSAALGISYLDPLTVQKEACQNMQYGLYKAVRKKPKLIISGGVTNVSLTQETDNCKWNCSFFCGAELFSHQELSRVEKINCC